jgi:hypothetical protein
MKITDIKAVAEIARSQPNVLLVVDNTFESAYFQVKLALNILTDALDSNSPMLCASSALWSLGLISSCTH